MKYIITPARPMSWSSMSSFEYSPEQWYDNYVLGKKQSSREMTFGSMIDKKFQNDPTFLPEVERFPILQHGMKVLFADIPLIGFSDGYDPGKRLMDLKTGKKPWDKVRADATGQLSMYSLMLYIQDKVKPEDLELSIVWLPTKEYGDFTIDFRDDPVVPQYFYTTRSMVDILTFGKRIKDTYKLMQEYVENHDETP
jgi:hypothetical protein